MHKEVINQEAQEISAREFIIKTRNCLRFLLSKWLIIICFVFLGSLIGFLVSRFIKPTYIASTTFVLEEDKSGGGGLSSLSGLASIAGVDIGGGGGVFQGDNILELYKSRTMIEKALLTEVSINNKKDLLINRFIEVNNLRDKWKNNAGLSNIKFSLGNAQKLSRLQDSVIREIVKEINSKYLGVGKPDKKLSIIKVDVKSTDETFSKAFSDQIVKNVNDFYIQTKTKKSIQNVAILQQKTDSVRAIMNGAIYTAAVVADATPNLNPTRQVIRTAPIQKSQFLVETNKAVLGELIKNLELSKISLMKETPLIQIIDEPILPLEKQKVSAIKGIVIGGAFLGVLVIIILCVKKIFKNILIGE